jgi:hypothetical protein
MIWKGKFADPSGVWRNQGSGTVRPLSRDVIRFAPGPDLDEANHPWIVDDGRPPRHHFQGYHLDSLQRPAFTYRFDQVRVEDYLVDLIDESSGSPALKRVIRFETNEPTEGLLFRVASGGSIEKLQDRLYRLNQEVLIRTDVRHAAEIVPSGDELRLVVPLQLGAGTTELEIHYLWQ